MKSSYNNKLRKLLGINSIWQIFENPGRIQFVLNMLYVNIFDLVKGTRFGGRLFQNEIGTNVERANDYSATPRCLIDTLSHLKVSNQDSIIDMGCGKGLAMYYMSKFPFKQIDGIELSRQLVQEARYNLNKVCPQSKGRINLICADAGKYKNYDKYNFFYIYNSFPRQVMREVIEQISISLERKPRKVFILYLYPEYADEFRRNQVFSLVKKGGENEIREGMHIYVNKEYRKQYWKMFD